MNQRFLRWVLNVAHKTESRYSRYGQTYFTVKERSLRWNSTICVVAFTPMLPLFLLKSEGIFEAIAGIGVVGMLVICWLNWCNLRFFHRMRRKNLYKEAKQRTRWMLNATPYYSISSVSFMMLILLGMLLSPQDDQILIFVAIFLFFLLPLWAMSLWIGIALTPFYTGFKKR